MSRKVIDHYLRLDRKRREVSHWDGKESHLFEPHVNYRMPEFDKGLSTWMVRKIVK